MAEDAQEDALEEMQAQLEGMQELLNFLFQTLSGNLSGRDRMRVHAALREIAEHYGDEPESLPIHHALRAVAQPRPKFHLVRPPGARRG